MIKVKTCTDCGTNFNCGITEADNTCWCTAFPKIMPMPDTGDCFCPTCLKKKIDEIQGNVKVTEMPAIK